MVGLVLALALALVVSVPTLAAKPEGFVASGIITEISPGDIFAAGNSDRWIVDEYQMFGTISGDVVPSVSGFEITGQWKP